MALTISVVSFSDIPYFKEVVIMATVCDYCGHKTNEVKSGGGIEAKGKRISLKVTDVSDMSRDVLKVSTASIFFTDNDISSKTGKKCFFVCVFRLFWCLCHTAS